MLHVAFHTLSVYGFYLFLIWIWCLKYNINCPNNTGFRARVFWSKYIYLIYTYINTIWAKILLITSQYRVELKFLSVYMAPARLLFYCE